MKICVNRKFVYKVIAGALLIVITFAVYSIKNYAFQGDWLKISDKILESETDGIENTKNPINSTAEGSEKTESVQDPKDMAIVVDIAGEVNRPSVYILPSGSRIYQGIEEAGGLTEDADTRNTNLAASLTDGMKLYIPTKKEVSAEEKNSGIPAGSAYVKGSTAVTSDSSGSMKAAALINLNTAASSELQKLPRVGPATAEKIIDYRNTYGHFKKKEELMNVSGIGEKTYEKLKNLITVE